MKAIVYLKFIRASIKRRDLDGLNLVAITQAAQDFRHAIAVEAGVIKRHSRRPVYRLDLCDRHDHYLVISMRLVRPRAIRNPRRLEISHASVRPPPVGDLEIRAVGELKAPHLLASALGVLRFNQP